MSGLALIDQAVAEHKPVAVFALFSGGHDSLVNTHLTAQHPHFTAVVHLNTGIGIGETRDFVRETCASHGWPLIERFPPRVTYEEMCLKRGMPGGPKKHEIMYHRLKGESLDTLIAETKTKRNDRVILSTGIRTQESARRMRLHAVPTRRDGVKVWVNPITDFSALDVSAYIEEHDLRRNPVVDNLHRSGECLCGALARPEELDEITLWYPEVGARIHDLERQCFERGLPWRWGSKPTQPMNPDQPYLPLCQSCPTRWKVGS
jgi:3'-phosphoadenosine 5'-phosphosulfate sulfotransferase (PAPS reductase)/FAD synthetase